MKFEREQKRRHLRCQLRQVSTVRVVGLQTAIEDLGTHMVHGNPVQYTRVAVWSVLTGRRKSDKMMELIARKRPDLFGLHYVPESVRKMGAELVRRLGSEPTFV